MINLVFYTAEMDVQTLIRLSIIILHVNLLSGSIVEQQHIYRYVGPRSLGQINHIDQKRSDPEALLRDMPEYSIPDITFILTSR